MKYGFIKVASAIPTVKVADCKFNAQQIDSIFERINASGAFVSGYMPCGTQVVGYPDMVDYTASKLNKQDMKLIMLTIKVLLQKENTEGIESWQKTAATKDMEKDFSKQQ